MSLTCHFFDATWTRKQVILNTKTKHGSHTGEYLKVTFLNMLDEWQISKDRVALVLRDSGANIVKGVRLAELQDLSCSAHTLQLVVNDGLTSQRAITDTIAMLKKCAANVHHSIVAKQLLQDIQRGLGLPQHNLIQAVPTRRNSTLHMLQRMLEQKRALTIYCGEHGGFVCPTAYQWDLVANLIETRIPIEEVTLHVSHSNSAAFCIILCLTVLKMLLCDDESPSTQGIGTIRQVMKESISKCFFKSCGVGCLSDPRYKSHAFSCAITLRKAIEWLKKEEVTQHTMQEPAATEASMTEQEANETEENMSNKMCRKENTSSRVDAIFSSLLTPHTGDLLTSSSIYDELHLYLKEPVIDRRVGDPLQRNKERF
uniref:ZF(BED)-4 zinc finger protein n=1 Tax=Phallusia mammillata TaxID=59560 RepID=A0A6F9DWQ8_9ASCI|nr:ZF(BED)-4 zinc finger protein [Phallusia mammillata]